MRLVHLGNDPASTLKRSLSGIPIFVKWLKRSSNVGLGFVIRWIFFGEGVEQILRPPH